jgi:hypothetical protein
MPRGRLNEDLEMLRDMRERLSAMLARVKAAPRLRDSDEFAHVTGELVRSLGAKIQALEKGNRRIETLRSRAITMSDMIASSVTLFTAIGALAGGLLSGPPLGSVIGVIAGVAVALSFCVLRT